MAHIKGPIINGEQYVVIVLKITEEDGFGRPQKADILHDDQTVNIQGGEKFITALVKERLVERQTKGTA